MIINLRKNACRWLVQVIDGYKNWCFEKLHLRTLNDNNCLQASLNLPKVNVMVLQASVVEEMCAFSALDRVKGRYLI